MNETVSLSTENRWPAYLLNRAAQPPPHSFSVVSESTPVVSFGHPLRPTIATLGINPSGSEFLGAQGLLDGEQRRLATLRSLGVRSYADIDIAVAARIVDDCASYFERHPYRWFKPLDTILKLAVGASYYAATACHLDLVQWATDPLWRKLAPQVQARLLSADRSFLIEQLKHEGFETVVVNGRTALEWVRKAGIVRWEEVARLEVKPTTRFYVGDTAKPTFVAWSCNLQSQPGALAHAPQLAALLERHTAEVPPAAHPLDDPAIIPKGTHFTSKRELVDYLRKWLSRSDSATIGDVSRFPGQRWISMETSFGLMDINADTKREAVERLVQVVETRGLDAKWNVIANNRGKINKVVFDLGDESWGWYAYLRSPLAEKKSF